MSENAKKILLYLKRFSGFIREKTYVNRLGEFCFLLDFLTFGNNIFYDLNLEASGTWM